MTSKICASGDGACPYGTLLFRLSRHEEVVGFRNFSRSEMKMGGPDIFDVRVAKPQEVPATMYEISKITGALEALRLKPPAPAAHRQQVVPPLLFIECQAHYMHDYLFRHVVIVGDFIITLA